MHTRVLATTTVEGGVIELESIFRANPELVATGVILGILLLTAAGLIWRYLTRTRADQLRSVLSSFEDVAVLMHPNPDPDAMGAAIGVREMAESAGTPAQIYFPGEIRHQENRAFRTVLDLDFEPLESEEELDEEGLVLVDHNRPRGVLGASRIDPDVVIDHHPGDGTGTEFTDVRPTYGACSSIVAEYFADLDAVITDSPETGNATDGGELRSDDSPQLGPAIATGMMYGIQADTDHLTKGCSPAEFEASSYLFPGIDEDVLHRIANPQVTSSMLDTKVRAIRNREVNGSFAIADVGVVEEIDAIPQAAMELFRLEGITAVVVFGSKDETLHLSGRSRDDRVHMGRTLESVFEDVPMASAGGHSRMGGGQVPLQYLAGIGPSAVEEDQARLDLRESLFRALKGDL